MRMKNLGRASVALGIAALAMAMTVPAYAAGAAVCAVLGEVEINAPDGLDIAGLESTPTAVNFKIVQNSIQAFNTGVCSSAPTTNVLSAEGTVFVSTDSPISIIEVTSWTAGVCTGVNLGGLAYGAVALLNEGTGNCGGIGAFSGGDVIAAASFAPAAETNAISTTGCTSVCLKYATFYGGFAVVNPSV